MTCTSCEWERNTAIIQNTVFGMDKWVADKTICLWSSTLCPLVLTVHLTIYVRTYSTEQSLSWEANRFSASQEIPHILSNPKVHYLIYKCLPYVTILSQLKQVQYILLQYCYNQHIFQNSTNLVLSIN
jgi:hypothetical protein